MDKARSKLKKSMSQGKLNQQVSNGGKENLQAQANSVHKTNQEQAILDACWSGGDKLRTKILERISRSKKPSLPSTLANPVSKRAKTPNKGCRNQRHVANKVLLVQETERSNSSIMLHKPVHGKRSQLVNPSAPHKKINSYCSGSVSLADLRLHFGQIAASCKSSDDCAFGSEASKKHKARESEQQRMLKSKLSKFTTCTSKVRRSRKERKNCNVESSGSLLAISRSNANISLQNEKKNSKQKAANLSNANIILKKPKAEVKPVSTRKASERVISTTAKKSTHPNKCLVRKHLSELYDKVAVKVREIERNKRAPANKKSEKAAVKNPYQNVKSRVVVKPAVSTEIVFIH